MRLNLGYLLKSFLLYLNFKIQLGVRSVLWNPQSRIVIAMFRKKSFQNCYICFDEQTKTRERNRMNLRACKKNERKMEKNSMQLHTFLSFSFFLQPFYVDLCKNKSQQKKGVVQARQACQSDPTLRIQFRNCTMKFCKGNKHGDTVMKTGFSCDARMLISVFIQEWNELFCKLFCILLCTQIQTQLYDDI